MTIERTTPMQLHKGLVVQVLRSLKAGESVTDYLPTWEGTAEEAIAALEADPREWMHEFDKDVD